MLECPMPVRQYSIPGRGFDSARTGRPLRQIARLNHAQSSRVDKDKDVCGPRAACWVTCSTEQSSARGWS